MSDLSHIDNDGKARMVDINHKDIAKRMASASAVVLLNNETFKIVLENKSKKGDVLTTAKIAGIQAAKKVTELIPLSHQIPLDHVDINFKLNQKDNSITIVSSVKCTAKTGAEMEALTACSIAALTVYDMLKAVQKDILITDLCLLEKRGGKSGEYVR
jgi:molybdenum cofactor biosynthesis protein MoaC